MELWDGRRLALTSTNALSQADPKLGRADSSGSGRDEGGSGGGWHSLLPVAGAGAGAAAAAAAARGLSAEGAAPHGKACLGHVRVSPTAILRAVMIGGSPKLLVLDLNSELSLMDIDEVI